MFRWGQEKRSRRGQRRRWWAAGRHNATSIQTISFRQLFMCCTWFKHKLPNCLALLSYAGGRPCANMIYRTKNSSKSFSWISFILCTSQQRGACRLIVAGPNADKLISVFVMWCIRDDEQSHRTVRYQRFANTYQRNCISVASGYILKNALAKISRYLITAMPFFRLVDGDTWPSLYPVSQDCRYNH